MIHFGQEMAALFEFFCCECFRTPWKCPVFLNIGLLKNTAVNPINPYWISFDFSFQTSFKMNILWCTIKEIIQSFLADGLLQDRTSFSSVAMLYQHLLKVMCVSRRQRLVTVAHKTPHGHVEAAKAQFENPLMRKWFLNAAFSMSGKTLVGF